MPEPDVPSGRTGHLPAERGGERKSGGPDLLPRLGAFARLLHDAGMEAGPRRLTDATRALNYVDLKSQIDFRNSLRAVFVSRKEELATFEAAFDIFWAPPDPRMSAGQIPGRGLQQIAPPFSRRASLVALLK